MRDAWLVAAFGALVVGGCGGGARERGDRFSRTGEERCTRPRLVLEPPGKGNPDAPGRAELDVSSRPGRERIEYAGRRLEVRDVTGELLLAIDRSMDPDEERLPTVLRWTRASMQRADLLLRYPGRAHPDGGPEGCDVPETRLVVYRDLQPGAVPSLEEVVRRGEGCGAPAVRAEVRICEDGDAVRILRRVKGEGPRAARRSVRRFDDVTRRFGAPVRVRRRRTASPPP